MTTSDRPPRLMPDDEAAQVLHAALRVAVPVEDDAVVEARRHRLVGALEKEIARVPRELARQEAKGRLRLGLRLSAAAAAFLCLVGGGAYLFSVGDSSSLFAGSVSTANSKRTSPFVGQLLETGAEQERTYVLAGQTELSMRAGTRVRVAEDTEAEQAFQLGRGSILVSVPHHEAQRAVRVVTPHATISVKGTVFGVDVKPAQRGKSATTHVAVARGRVLVEYPSGQVVLGPGQSWTSANTEITAEGAGAGADSNSVNVGGPADLRAAGAQSHAAAPTDGMSHEQGRVAHASNSPLPKAQADKSNDGANPRDSDFERAGAELADDGAAHWRESSSNSPPSSTLARQNSLLEAALRAEKRGDVRRAEELVDRLLEEFPESPLRASAHAVKKRLHD